MNNMEKIDYRKALEAAHETMIQARWRVEEEILVNHDISPEISDLTAAYDTAFRKYISLRNEAGI